MTKPEPVCYRMTNWKHCNDALRRRGSLLIWLDKDMTWLASKAGRPGRPPVFFNGAIQFCLMVAVPFGLPLRQAAGMVANFLAMAGLGWPVPDFSALSRRQKTFAVQMLHRRAAGPLNLLVDNVDDKVQAPSLRAPRRMGSRFWAMEIGSAAGTAGTAAASVCKVHLAMDTATGDVRAVEFTSSRESDSPFVRKTVPRTVFLSSSLPDLPGQILSPELTS